MRTIKYDTWNISKTYHCMEVPGWSQFKDPSCSKKKKINKTRTLRLYYGRHYTFTQSVFVKYVEVSLYTAVSHLKHLRCKTK